ncbi:hypothetical protein FHW84_003594 [Dyella sp. SG562]|uniref:hypothetical protein n=1 Tax=Dyella TaxID=231454 RepID=UPI0014212991|nr:MULTISPECIES: hypothetical protein [unclassified Dyella]NII74997.1 hypothetical protein [Dyella sp. SG562]NKJ20251.1 hypothetical protein [Dyella sp. SG609]
MIENLVSVTQVHCVPRITNAGTHRAIDFDTRCSGNISKYIARRSNERAPNILIAIAPAQAFDPPAANTCDARCGLI